MPNTANPELVYWFISPDEQAEAEYRRQLEVLKQSGTFDFVFLTGRGSTNFYDVAKMHPIFKDLVARAHAQGMKVGLQLWTRERDVPDDQLQGIVSEDEMTLDAKGHGAVVGVSRGVRSNASGRFLYAGVRSEVLRVYAFKKTGDGAYAPGSLVDLTAKVKATPVDALSVGVEVNAPELAGYTVYVMTLHYHRFPDMFSPFMTQSFVDVLKAYQDVGFDGAGLDEYRYMTIGRAPGKDFRERFYTPRMAERFKQETGAGLERTLFDMRYAAAGDETPRLVAINRYFDLLKRKPLEVEQAFYKATVATMGPGAFHGIHDTWHNALESDEVWGTGIAWWEVPRDYAQTDETTPQVTRLGMSMARPKPVEYNQYYTKDLHRFLAEGLDDARYNGRVHYHAMHDVQGWGIDVVKPELLGGITKVEDKVRLLNAFDAPRPALDVLFLFGMPSLLNYVQKDGVRSEWDINANLKAEEKAGEAWKAGYRGALAPMELIANGTITVDAQGGMVFGGQRFTHVVMFGPEYSKEGSLAALEKFVAGGGKLLLDGVATRDFAGRDVSARFSGLAAKAVGTEFSLAAMEKLGAAKTALEGGARYVDGSVVLTDLDSLLDDKPKAFSVEVAGHVYSGSYEGLLALKVDAGGAVEKLAAGHLDGLLRDGKPVVSLSKASDVVVRKTGKAYEETVVGDASVLWR